jgi:citrate lyase synthetase
MLTFWLVNLVFAHYLAKLLRVQHRLVGVEAYPTPVATIIAIFIT